MSLQKWLLQRNFSSKWLVLGATRHQGVFAQYLSTNPREVDYGKNGVFSVLAQGVIRGDA
jgi:hypothetical protein